MDGVEKAILLVEDNPDDEELTLLAFRKNNFSNPIHVVRDGAEALDYLFGTGPYAMPACPPLPIVILLDLKLPKVDGLEVLRRLRAHERTSLVPVVILTSSREGRDLFEGYSSGANSYVVKPVEFENFIQAMGQLGVYWTVLNEPPPDLRGRNLG